MVSELQSICGIMAKHPPFSLTLNYGTDSSEGRIDIHPHTSKHHLSRSLLHKLIRESTSMSCLQVYEGCTWNASYKSASLSSLPIFNLFSLRDPFSQLSLCQTCRSSKNFTFHGNSQAMWNLFKPTSQLGGSLLSSTRKF